MFLIAVFVFGLIIGSFLNVVLYRFGTGRKVTGRSSCNVCGKRLSWYELFPVVSFIVQRGRCRGCEARVSMQYPLVELATGLLFTAFFIKTTGGYFSAIAIMQGFGILDILGLICLFAIAAFFVLIIVYDFRHMIIPDTFSYGFAIAAFLYVLISGVPEGLGTRIIAGLIIALPFALLWAVSRGRAIGFGDAKLALGIGIFLGVSGGFAAVLLAFWIGAAIAILIMLISKVKGMGKDAISMKTAIPLGPFLIVGTIIVYLTGLKITDILLL